MDDSSGFLLVLAVWWLFFFFRELTTWKQATGELIGNHFPHWKWLGRKFRLTDNIYYYYPASIPFLSTFYPPHFLSAFISRFLSINNSFRLFNLVNIGHYLLSSILSFVLLRRFMPEMVALIGAITWPYMATTLKIHNPCVGYTLAWIPGMFLGGWIGALSVGMAILAGYYPMLTYFLPIAVIWHPETALGLLLGLPQIVPFLIYLPKSCRWKQPQGKTGGTPIYRFLSLFGHRWDYPAAGLLPLETEMFMGILPILAIANPVGWIGVLLGILAIGLRIPLLRHPCRLLMPMTTALTIGGCLSVPPDLAIPILILQAFSLLPNRNLYPMIPYQEHDGEPEKLFNTKLIREIRSSYKGGVVSNLPHPNCSGYMYDLRTPGYTGGFRLKTISEMRNIEDPNGESAHDWFLTNDDNDVVSFAYRPSVDLSNEWEQTKIKGLWKRKTEQTAH